MTPNFKILISPIYVMKLLGIIVMNKMTKLIILNIEHNYILKWLYISRCHLLHLFICNVLWEVNVSCLIFQLHFFINRTLYTFFSGVCKHCLEFVFFKLFCIYFIPHNSPKIMPINNVTMMLTATAITNTDMLSTYI